MIDEICPYRTKGPTQALELIRHFSAHARMSTALREVWLQDTAVVVFHHHHHLPVVLTSQSK
jgi:hypothetical protein